jgi:hypothetical protein
MAVLPRIECDGCRQHAWSVHVPRDLTMTPDELARKVRARTQKSRSSGQLHKVSVMALPTDEKTSSCAVQFAAPQPGGCPNSGRNRNLFPSERPRNVARPVAVHLRVCLRVLPADAGAEYTMVLTEHTSEQEREES